MNKSNIALSTTLLLLIIIGGSAWMSQSANEPKNTLDNDPVYVDILLPETTQEDLKKESDLIVTGEISDNGKGIVIEKPNGSREIYTDYAFEIHDVLKGVPSDKQISVRIMGGKTELGELVSNSISIPVFEKGKHYLLFLYQPNMGGGFNTLGDYYYVLGQSQGSYVLAGETSALNKTYHAQFEPSLSFEIDDLKSDLSFNQAAYQHSPTDYREKVLANAKANLDSGFFTEDEYQDVLKKMDEYAEIIYEETPA